MPTSVVDGCAVHTRGAGTPVVVGLPGFTDSVASWRPLVDVLARRLGTAVIELPGLSHPIPRPDSSSLDQFADRIARVVGHRWSAPVVLVGHSLGSVLAVRAAHRLAGQCEAIVSIEGNLTADDAFFTGQAAGFDDAEAFKAHLAGQARRLAAEGRAPASFADSIGAADAHTVWTLGREVAECGTGVRFGEELRRAPCRTLYLWSARTAAPASQEFLHHLTHEELGLGHHWPWLVDAERVAERIVDCAQQ